MAKDRFIRAAEIGGNVLGVIPFPVPSWVGRRIIPDGTNFVVEEKENPDPEIARQSHVVRETQAALDFATEFDGVKKRFAGMYMQTMGKILRLEDNLITTNVLSFPTPQEIRDISKPVSAFIDTHQPSEDMEASVTDIGGTKWDIKIGRMPTEDDPIQRYESEVSFSYTESEVVSYSLKYAGVHYTDGRPSVEGIHLSRFALPMGRRAVVFLEFVFKEEGYVLHYTVRGSDDSSTRKELFIGKDGKVVPAAEQPAK